jgi:hypothetical protein
MHECCPVRQEHEEFPAKTTFHELSQKKGGLQETKKNTNSEMKSHRNKCADSPQVIERV